MGRSLFHPAWPGLGQVLHGVPTSSEHGLVLHERRNALAPQNLWEGLLKACLCAGVVCRFEPCEWSDLSCHALVDIAAVSGTPLRGIVGHHKNAGTWLKGYSDAEAAPLSLQLRLKLRADTWATLVGSPPSSHPGGHRLLGGSTALPSCPPLPAFAALTPDFCTKCTSVLFS